MLYNNEDSKQTNEQTKNKNSEDRNTHLFLFFLLTIRLMLISENLGAKQSYKIKLKFTCVLTSRQQTITVAVRFQRTPGRGATGIPS